MNLIKRNKFDKQHDSLKEMVAKAVNETQYVLTELKIDDGNFGNVVAVVSSNKNGKTYRFVHDRGDVYVEVKTNAMEWKLVDRVAHEECGNKEKYALLISEIYIITHK